MTHPIKKEYQKWSETQRKKKGILFPTSGELDQLSENGSCKFCGSTKTANLSQYEKMVVFITSIKSNPMVSMVGADYLGFLVGYLRQKFCPEITVDQCEQIVHAVSHLKDISLDEMKDSNLVWENIGEARIKLCNTGKDGMLLNNENCICECHKNGKEFCDNCSSHDNMAKDGIWHLGKEEKELLFAFAKELG